MCKLFKEETFTFAVDELATTTPLSAAAFSRPTTESPPHPATVIFGVLTTYKSRSALSSHRNTLFSRYQSSPLAERYRCPLLLAKMMKCSEWLFMCSLITLLSSPSSTFGNAISNKVLHVGGELFKETMPLQSGACLYNLQGLKPQTWYEVKISYPASIPASFSLQLERGTPDVGLDRARKLLNTEKIIFKTDEMTSLIEQGKMSVLLNVEPEGVVAISGKQEREYIIYNIVCDELLLGIPHEAWYIVILVLLCLVLASMVPSYLPAFLLPKNGRQTLFDHTLSKAS